MQILLPPSETKRSGGSGAFAPRLLHADGELGSARVRVRAALESVCRDRDVALKLLKLGPKNQGELAHNLQLDDSGVLPAIERYTGVVYDALDAASLDPESRGWINTNVFVQSALFGLLRADNLIPAYRLSAGSRLPGLGLPLKGVWSDAHAGLRWSGFVLDLRSKDYVALAPLPADVGYFLHVVQRGADGQVRALNHFNKAAKGALVGRLARSRADVQTVEQLITWAGTEGLEITLEAGRLTLVWQDTIRYTGVYAE
jgi:cytoplasmic iron level regulating protein YaaA (DUF328/UPF0246 family)